MDLQENFNETPKNQTDFIAVLGAKGSGKTLFTTALLSSIIDGHIPQMTGTVSEATHEFLNRHLLPIRNQKQWPEPTRGWQDLNLSLRWENQKIHDYKIQFQDIQGSDFETSDGELIKRMQDAKAYFFIVSPKHLLTHEELQEAAGENAYLECIIPEEGRFARQMNWNYAQILEKIISAHHIEESNDKKISRPISVIFTRKDDYPHLDIEKLKQKFQGTFKWFQAHARYVEYFFVSSVGKTVAPDPEQDAKTKKLFISQYGDSYNLDLPAKKNPPEEICPEGVIEPLMFVLQAFAFESTRIFRKRVQIAKTSAIAVFALLFLWWISTWVQNYYLTTQMRQQSAQILNEFIAENPTQILDIYNKTKDYLKNHGENHKEGKEFLEIKKRLSSQVQEEWYNKVSQIARENDQDTKSVRDYNEACRAIEEYLRSEFPDGKKYLREMYLRLEQRMNLAKMLDEFQESQVHADYRHALFVLDEYLKKHSFQRLNIQEKRQQLQITLSASLYTQALEQAKVYNARIALDEKVLSLESFYKKEQAFFTPEDAAKLEAEIWELRAQLARKESKEAFDKRDYKNAERVLKNFERLERLPETIKKNIHQDLQQLYAQEYQQELSLALQFKGKVSLNALATFYDKYLHHNAFDETILLNKVCIALADVVKEVQQTNSWEQGINTFTQEEQRFANLTHEPDFWKFFLPVINGRIFQLADIKNYEGAWSVLKIYETKLSGQIRLKKYVDQLQEWAHKLAQLEMDNKWKQILLEEKPETSIILLEKLRRYDNQPYFTNIYRSEYKEKIEEKRFQLCIQQYEENIAKKDYAQARLILEQYEGWGTQYTSRINDMHEAVNKQEIMDFWNSCLVKVENDFLTTLQKLEVTAEFQRLHRERPGYKYIEDDVEVLAKGMSSNLKEERKTQVAIQIERAFNDETALPKAQESLDKYQNQYPGDTSLSHLQAQIHEAKINWAGRHLQDCEDTFDSQKKYDAYEQYLRKYSTNKHLYRELLHNAEKGKQAAAIEWDKREFQKADSAWRNFQYRADEFSPEEGRKHIEEISRLYEEYGKHWGPEKQYLNEAKEQMLFLRQLLGGARYTIKLVSGKFAQNYWVYNPTVEVSVKINGVTYPFSTTRDKQDVKWNETKEFYWKAYESVTLEITDTDKKKNNELIAHKEVGCFSLIKFCTHEDKQEKRLIPKRTINNENNSITFELVSSTVARINQWYGIKGKSEEEK